MSKEWTYFNLSCRDCGHEGTLEIWSDDWFQWGAEWAGFKGMARITGPQTDTIECLKCKSGNVEITKREQF